MFSILTAAALLAGQVAPPPRPLARANAPIGRETVITYAGNGGLRDWRRVPGRRDALFVRDRTERWYRVTLSGPCGIRQELDTLSYTTDVNGIFDRFSRIRFGSFPAESCLVRSIVASAPPPSQRSRPKRG